MIERYMPLARSVARRYRNSTEPIEDLVQVAALGLVKAVDRWDPSRGTAFSSFAVPTMTGEIKRHFRDRTWVVRPSRDLQELWLAVERARDDLWRDLGHPPTVSEIASHLGRPIEAVMDAVSAGYARATQSLDVPVPGDDGDSATLGELVGADDDEFERVDTSATIDEITSILSPREREILRLRFVEDLTQSEIGDLIGCSQMHVSRILRNTLARLRAETASQELVAD